MLTGLLNLEQLLRQFLISKETLSVRMLDDSQDPTPLLKEIRDDKTATIIVDANATMSHIILERVSMVYLKAVSFLLCLDNISAVLEKNPKIHTFIILVNFKYEIPNGKNCSMLKLFVLICSEEAVLGFYRGEEEIIP